MTPDPTPTPTLDLVARARDGEEDALQDLMERKKLKIRYLVWLQTRGSVEDPGRQEEIFLEVCYRIYKNLSRFEARDLAGFHAWTKEIVRTATIDLLRHEKAGIRDRQKLTAFKDSHAFLCAPSRTGIGTRLDAQQDHERLFEVLQDLSEEDRSILDLRFFEELSLPEMSELAGVSSSTLHDRLKKAERALKQAWLKRYPPPG